jgi:hypothetical protein
MASNPYRDNPTEDWVLIGAPVSGGHMNDLMDALEGWVFTATGIKPETLTDGATGHILVVYMEKDLRKVPWGMVWVDVARSIFEQTRNSTRDPL